MIALGAVNVLLRYAFSFGAVWAQELEWHLLAALILLGMCKRLPRCCGCSTSARRRRRAAMFEPQTYAILMLVAFFALLMPGVPVATTLATVGFIFGYLGFGDSLFSLLPARFYGIVAGYQWMAIPLFVFMGVMLEKSRLADDLLDVMGVGIILFLLLLFFYPQIALWLPKAIGWQGPLPFTARSAPAPATRPPPWRPRCPARTVRCRCARGSP